RGPEPFVALGIGGPQADVREAPHPAVARGKEPPSAVVRAHDELVTVPARVGEADEVLDVSRLALGARAAAHLGLVRLELGRGRVEGCCVRNLPSRRVVRGIALEVDERVVAVVAAEIRGVAFPARELEPEDALRVLGREPRVARSEANVPKVLEVDHALLRGRGIAAILIPALRAGTPGQYARRAFSRRDPCSPRSTSRSGWRNPSASSSRRSATSRSGRTPTSS